MYQQSKRALFLVTVTDFRSWRSRGGRTDTPQNSPAQWRPSDDLAASVCLTRPSWPHCWPGIGPLRGVTPRSRVEPRGRRIFSNLDAPRARLTRIATANVCVFYSCSNVIVRFRFRPEVCALFANASAFLRSPSYDLTSLGFSVPRAAPGTLGWISFINSS